MKEHESGPLAPWPFCQHSFQRFGPAMDKAGIPRPRPPSLLEVHYPTADDDMNRKQIRSLLTLLSAVLITGVAAPAAATDQVFAFGAASDPPRLSISNSPGELIIQWPLVATDWVLEQSPTLSPISVWTVVPLAFAQTNGTNLSLALSPSAENMFYRLSLPASLIQPVSGLTAEWRLDEGQSQTAQDATGHENHAALFNVEWGAGRIGAAALWFNGGTVGPGASRAVVSNDNYRILPPSGRPFSVSLWFNPDALTIGWRGLAGNAASSSNGWFLALHTSGPGTNELVFGSAGSSGLNVAGRKLLLPGQWHEVTATYNGSEGFLYLDGELLAHGSGSISANDEPIYFGGGIANYNSFLGLIDEVCLYTNALTHEEISLTGRWRLDENKGTLAADTSIHRHHARLSDFTAWTPGKNDSGINVSNSTVTIRNDFADVLPPTGGSFSLSFWLYPRSLPAGWSGLISCADSTNSGWHLAVHGGSPSERGIHFWATDSGGTLDLFVPVALAEENWTKLDLTFNGGIATLYLNGLKAGSASGGIQGKAAPLIVGVVPDMPNFNGIIDELKIYRRELDETEIGPVAKVMWETVLINSSTNLVLQGFGPNGKPLSYSIANSPAPTNGTLTHVTGSSTVTYTAGSAKGPDAFAYTVSDGEFTTPATIVVMSVVEPHWLSPTGGTVAPFDGSSPEHAWIASPADALDAIWRTNNYYDCFFYTPGEFQTTGWKYLERGTANPGCKHIGSGSEGPNRTTLKLVNIWHAWAEELIFGLLNYSLNCDGFEVHNLLLDCNAANNPLYAIGEPVWITIPLMATSRVETVKLRWYDRYFAGNGYWHYGPARQFNLCTRTPGMTDYITNCLDITSTGQVDIITLGVETDQIILQLNRRADRVDFYSLAEVEIDGASVSLPAASMPGGGESRLTATNAEYSILHVIDGDNGSVWASGPESQVQIVLPLQPGTTISQLNLSWNCHTITNLGRLGPASNYRIQARDQITGDFYDVPFTAGLRTAGGNQVNAFATPIVTDQLVLLLTSRELGVDFYSLREVNLFNGSSPVALKAPTSLNSLLWGGNHDISRAFDRDLSTQWASGTQGSVTAIAASGSNLKFTKLRIIGFGTKAARECFPMNVSAPPPFFGPTTFGNVLIEDCIFSNPATNNSDGLTTLRMADNPPQRLTNTVVRRCTIDGLKAHFVIAHGFSVNHVENSLVSGCSDGVYFEPEPGVGAQSGDAGNVLIRSNRFESVNQGIYLFSHAGTVFESLTCIDNEIVLSGNGGWAFADCDTCDAGPSGSITNATILRNIIRYPDWSPRPFSYDGGLHYSDIHHAIFGNNVIALGTPNSFRLRQCPSGYLPPPKPIETCDFETPILPPAPNPPYPACLDTLPIGYRRGWFNNRDLQGALLKMRYLNNSSDGFASQQQWP